MNFGEAFRSGIRDTSALVALGQNGYDTAFGKKYREVLGESPKKWTFRRAEMDWNPDDLFRLLEQNKVTDNDTEGVLPPEHILYLSEINGVWIAWYMGMSVSSFNFKEEDTEKVIQMFTEVLA